MAFTETDRVKIRHWLGYGSQYLASFPMLEQAVTLVQSIADGGQRPDTSTEVSVKALMVRLDAINTKIDENLDYLVAIQVSKLRVDAARAIAMLRSQGRRLVHELSIYLGNVEVKEDVFGVAEVRNTGIPGIGTASVRGSGW